MVEKLTPGKVAFRIFNTLLLIFIAAACILPIWHVIMSSFTDPLALSLHSGVVLWPDKWSLAGYRKLVTTESVWNGYLHTLIYVALHTVIGLFLTSLGAYVLSRKGLKLKNKIMAMITFTMLFNGGLIPNYIVMYKLGLLDTIWAVVIPGMVSPMNLIIMRTFFNGIPDSLEESAKLDGAGAWRILFSIYYPLSKASLATISLFLIVAQWNSYFLAMIYLQTRELWPLQLVLREIINSQNAGEITASEGSAQDTAERIMLVRVIKNAVIVVGTLPIFVLYPFIQKYFVKGVMIGSIKG